MNTRKTGRENSSIVHRRRKSLSLAQRLTRVFAGLTVSVVVLAGGTAAFQALEAGEGAANGDTSEGRTAKITAGQGQVGQADTATETSESKFEEIIEGSALRLRAFSHDQKIEVRQMAHEVSSAVVRYISEVERDGGDLQEAAKQQWDDAKSVIERQKEQAFEALMTLETATSDVWETERDAAVARLERLAKLVGTSGRDGTATN